MFAAEFNRFVGGLQIIRNITRHPYVSQCIPLNVQFREGEADPDVFPDPICPAK